MEYQRYDSTEGTRLEFQGNLDALTAPTLRELIEGLASERPPLLRIDIARLSFLDSSGVAAIVSLYKRQRAAGGALLVTGATGQPLQVLRLLGIDAVLCEQ